MYEVLRRSFRQFTDLDVRKDEEVLTKGRLAEGRSVGKLAHGCIGTFVGGFVRTVDLTVHVCVWESRSRDMIQCC
jgi:hypothetical protein